MKNEKIKLPHKFMLGDKKAHLEHLKEIERLDKIELKIHEMIRQISGTDNLIDARAECLYSGHLFEKHLANELHLTPKQMADIAFTIGRSSQLGVLFGVLWHTNNINDDVETKAKKLYEDALNGGEITWRKKSSETTPSKG